MCVRGVRGGGWNLVLLNKAKIVANGMQEETTKPIVKRIDCQILAKTFSVSVLAAYERWFFLVFGRKLSMSLLAPMTREKMREWNGITSFEVAKK